MPESAWYFCTQCGELFPWPADKPGPTRCPVDGCPRIEIHAAPAPESASKSAPATKGGARRKG